MPIVDCYCANHIIRTEQPFKSLVNISNIPIVAMTASAIQGDMERCQKAGMDDYLSKPVKGELLEKMLVKWAIEGKRKRKLDQQNEDLQDEQPLNRTLYRPPDSVATAQHPQPASPMAEQLVED